jgi:hypothetical protein
VQSLTSLKSTTSSSRRCSAVPGTSRPFPAWPCSRPSALRGRLRDPAGAIRRSGQRRHAAGAPPATQAKAGVAYGSRRTVGRRDCAYRSRSAPRSARHTPRTRTHRRALAPNRSSEPSRDALGAGQYDSGLNLCCLFIDICLFTNC